jgi:hypothetical protein
MARALIAGVAVLAFIFALGLFVLEADRPAAGFAPVGLLALSVIVLMTFAEPPAPPAPPA